MSYPYPVPRNEQERLSSLKSYDILDSMPEQEYDELTTIASAICQTPVSLISLLDDTRQWFKSTHGISIIDTPREFAFCSHTIMNPDEVLIVPDSRNDERFKDNPLVTNDPSVIFYAGAPLVTPDGYPLGSICVIDTKERHLNNTQVEALRVLARHVVNLLELRKSQRVATRMKRLLEQRVDELSKIESLLQQKIAPNVDMLAQNMQGLLSSADYQNSADISGLTELLNTVSGIQQDIRSALS